MPLTGQAGYGPWFAIAPFTVRPVAWNESPRILLLSQGDGADQVLFTYYDPPFIPSTD